jgi:DNA-binding transcriptional LysR family regulator
LRVGTVVVLSQMGDLMPGLVELLRRFRREYPAVDVRLSQRLSHELLHDVAAGQLDIAFCGQLTPAVPGVTTVALGQARLQLICAPSHPLSARASVTLAELSAEPFVHPPSASVLRSLIDQAFADAGLEKHSQFEVNDVNAYLELVAQGVGVALFPGIPGRAPLNLCSVPLDPPGPPWQLVAAVPVGPKVSATARALLAMIPPAAEQARSET